MRTRFNYPTRILFGEGVVDQVAIELKAFPARRPLLVTDEGLLPTGIPDRVVKLLEASACTVAVFAGVAPNPTDAQVDAGAAAFRAHVGDAIVAVGGGSALDAAKAIQMRVHHPGPLEEYDDLKGGDARITGPLPPLIAVPTTSGTGSEVGRSAVITVAAVDRKVVIFAPGLLPRVALCDPELTCGLPPRLTAETGMDALSHSLEAYLASGYHPMADGIALRAIAMVAESLPRAVANGRDADARRDMMAAAMMGATAFQKGLGVCHSLAHPLSSVAGVGHGLANAILMPHVVRFNAEAVGARAADVARALGAAEAGAEGAARAIEALAARIGLPSRLSAVGVTEADIARMVPKAMEDGCHGSNPRPVDAAQMEALYRAAM